MKNNAIEESIHLRGMGGALLENIHTGKKTWIPFKNIVTDAGDLYYAERGALLTVGSPIAPVPTTFTDTNGVPDMIMELYDTTPANNAPIKANDRGDLLGHSRPARRRRWTRPIRW